MISDLNTYLTKAIPDTRLTIKKYADAKFEYLVSSFIRISKRNETYLLKLLKWKSYCLKVKEMDDEEYTYISLDEPLYRVETGNYEYR